MNCYCKDCGSFSEVWSSLKCKSSSAINSRVINNQLTTHLSEHTEVASLRHDQLLCKKHPTASCQESREAQTTTIYSVIVLSSSDHTSCL